MKNKLVKIILATFFAVAVLSMVAGAAAFFPSASTAVVAGDANYDGRVSVRDASRILQYVAGWNVEIDEVAADVVNDGVVNNLDAARILQYLAGWNVEFDNNEPEKYDYRIISSYDKDFTNDDEFCFYYTVINPFTGKREIVPGVKTSSKASTLNTGYSVGDLIELEDGFVDDKMCDRINNLYALTDSLVWISDYDTEHKTMTVAPVGLIAPADENCKECLKEALAAYNAGFDGIDYNGIDNSFATNFVKITDDTVVTVIKYDSFDQIFNYGLIDRADISVLEEPTKDYLCYNYYCVDKNNNYFTGYADYLKAYVKVKDKNSDPAVEELEAEFVIIVVTDYEPSAYDATYNTPCTANPDHN